MAAKMSQNLTAKSIGDHFSRMGLNDAPNPEACGAYLGTGNQNLAIVE
jgi:hypothetical protein